MHTHLTLRGTQALVPLLAWLLFTPIPGTALAAQVNPPEQKSAPPAPSVPHSTPAQPAANQPTGPGKAATTPREQAWQILEEACTGDKSGDRATAIQVLGLIPNDARSARLAQNALTDERPEVRAAAAAALGNMHSRASIPKLKAAMDDQDPSVALAAAHALNLMHDNSAYEVYYEILNGERKAGKGLIASQTSMLRDPKKMAEFGFEEGIGFIPFAGIGWDAIKAIRKDDSSPVRAAAARVLARDPDPATTKALIEATGDKSWIVQLAALEALAKRNDPSALPTVNRYLSDEKGAIKFTAAAAVIHLTAIKQARTAKRRVTLDHKRP